jgi:hypothetical protein
MSATPARRSTRIAASTGRSVVETNAATTATPATGTTRRKGALPKVKPRDSNAYGSSSRLGEAEELGVPASGFAQAFEQQRGDAVVRDAIRDDERIETRLSSIHDWTPTSSLEPSEEVQKSFGLDRETAMTAQGRLANPIVWGAGPTRLNSSLRRAAFVASLGKDDDLPSRPTANAGPSLTTAKSSSHTGMALGTNAPPPNNGPSLTTAKSTPHTGMAHSSNPPPPNNGGGAPPFTPAPRRDTFWSWTAHLKWILCGLGVAALSIALFGLLKHKNVSGVSSTNTTLYDDIPSGSIQWTVSTPNAEYIPASNVYGEDSPIDESMPTPKADTIPAVNTHGEDIPISERGDNSLWPRVSALEHKAESSEASMKAAFKRLEELLPNGLMVKKTDDDNIELQDDFWRAILSKMHAEGLGRADLFKSAAWVEFVKKNEEKMDEWATGERRNYHYVTREQYMTLLEHHYKKVSKYVEQQVEAAWPGLESKMHDQIDVALRRQLLDKVRIESVAFAHLVANAEVRNGKTNFFSPGNGAHVIPSVTSPTHIEPRSILAVLYETVFSFRKHLPPSASLHHWEEPGDCWCASPDEKEKGLIQIAVALGQDMYPREVTVEHLPKRASISIKSAPQDMELWVPGEPKGDDRSQCKAGPSGWRCLGKFTYDVHAPYHVQTFDLDTVVEEPVRKTMLRVTSNWGADYTCLYRLRLHGDPANPEKLGA